MDDILCVFCYDVLMCGLDCFIIILAVVILLFYSSCGSSVGGKCKECPDLFLLSFPQNDIALKEIWDGVASRFLMCLERPETVSLRADIIHLDNIFYQSCS